jgi:Transglutaminase-like superfamily
MPYLPTRSQCIRVLASWFLLAITDITLKIAGFGALYTMLTWWPTIGRSDSRNVTSTCAAVDRALRFYFKDAWCLQAAATGACLLRLCGVPASFVVGVRKAPFQAHAWVEVNGDVVMNNQEGLRTLYQVITRSDTGRGMMPGWSR